MSDSLQKDNQNNKSIRKGGNSFQFIPNDAFGAASNEENIFDPKKIVSLLLRYKWIILAFLIAGATGAWFFTKTLTPVYESTGTLMINSADSPNDELSKIISQTTGYGTISTLENELQVLQSKSFSLKIARSLIDEDPGGIDRFPVLWTEEESGEVYKTDEDVVASRIRNSLDFRQPEEKSEVIEISFKSPSPEEAAKIVNEAMQIYVKSSTQQNRQAAESTTEFLKEEKQKLKEKLDNSEEKLRNYMDNTGIVQVDEQASTMVTQRANTELELQRVNLELKALNKTISSYEKQLERVKPGLADQLSEAIGPRIQNSQDELAKYENERAQILAKNPNVLKRDPLPARLKFVNEQIARLKEQIKNLSNRLFTEDNEFTGISSEERAKMVSDIQSQLTDLRIKKNQYESRKDALQKQKNEMDADFNSLPKGMIELAKLKRDVKINEELYMNVSKKYADMSIWKQSQFGFGRIIDKGEIPSTPVSPNKKIFILLGLMLGCLLSAGFIVIREFLDDSVKSAEQLRNHILPTLTFSAVPSFDKISEKDRKTFTIGNGQVPHEMVILRDRQNLASESIRRLKNNIIYQHGDTPPKTIAVTSPEKGDGKSTIVANLGVAFAEEGYKTLLVGADFRRPKLVQYFGLTGKEGLSDYLNGDLSFQESLMSIQNTEVNTLKVITAGKKNHRPEIIGNSKRFKEFLKKMEEAFDVIILDTPPYGIISDSTAVLKDAEITVVVARYRKTNKEMLVRTIEELGQIKANVTDIVLNDFDPRKEIGNYNRGGYYQTMYSNYEVYVK
ncbi:MAG: polysaccharide biosynthesis tyrosine autokinase [Balneolaceae bacterium]|jgi:capsular exopolysaccharide synthesis family protein